MQPNWKKWFSGRGRAGRREYWNVVLLAAIGSAALHFALATLVLSVPGAAYPATAAYFLFMGVSAWLIVCAASRRLHDLGHSGWWQVAAIALGIVGGAVLEPAWSPALGLDETSAPLVALPFGAAFNLFFVGIGLIRAKTDENRFGPPPA